MKKIVTISVSPEVSVNENLLKKTVAEQLQLNESDITFIKLLKRSIDARSKNVMIVLTAEVHFGEPAPAGEIITYEYPDVKNKPCVVIVGCGPAGMFAALQLINMGIKPIILERGRDVRSRRRDLAAINKLHIVNPDSNYCFGEGGAGTYSDGKLYTRSTKKGDVKKILRTFISHGANENILIDAHPHIGTNNLPKVVEALRQTILNAGGEIHFNSRVNDFILDGNEIKTVRFINTLSPGDEKGNEVRGKAVILATGHSARDIFYLLKRKNILIESKPFAMGVRVEHSQELIDSIQYHCDKRSLYLPAAAYSLTAQIKNRGVYSFCMCPGGFIVPAATSPGEVVVNGMSPSKRDSKFANSGIVVSIEPEDYTKYMNQEELAGLMFQMELEKMAFEAGGKSQAAPAQRLVDFCDNKFSSTLPDCSYQPGILSAPLHTLLPETMAVRLQSGLKEFGKKLHSSRQKKGFFTNEAVILGVESRTSSPVRIPRDKFKFHHVQIKNLYPCGEGAGYAGGIVSAAMDGELCAEAAALNIV